MASIQSTPTEETNTIQYRQQRRTNDYVKINEEAQELQQPQQMKAKHR
jgi:hypothetical protein